jgi:hypothetical protein
VSRLVNRYELPLSRLDENQLKSIKEIKEEIDRLRSFNPPSNNMIERISDISVQNRNWRKTGKDFIDKYLKEGNEEEVLKWRKSYTKCSEIIRHIEGKNLKI